MGIAAAGLAAADADPSATSAWEVREVPASFVAVLDVVRGRRPIFAGPRDHSLDPVATGGRA